MKLTKNQLNKLVFSFLLLISILAIAKLYRFDRIATLPPQSLHAWRQTDCASQALNYYQHGMKFFQPELHSLISDNGTSGYSVEEFPFVFYSVAALYKVFGYSPAIYRLFTFFFFIIGVFACSSLFNLFWNNRLASGLAALLLFSSTTMAFYSINFICNIPSIAVMLVGWVFFFLFYFNQEKKLYLFLSLVLFGFAVLLKISEGLSFCVIGCIWLIERLKIYRFGKEQSPLIPNWVSIVMLFITVVVFAWYKWAHYYNFQHQQTYYAFQINPIWSLSSGTISHIYGTMKNRWLFDYISPYGYALFSACWIFVIVFWKQCHPLLKTISVLLLAGSLVYVAMFFCNMNDHDYYMLSTYITFWFALLTAGELFVRKYKDRLKHLLVIVLAFVLVCSIPATRNRLNQRYFNWEFEFPQTSVYQYFYKIEPELEKMGIHKSDKVISIPDFSICYTLYLMNRQGWTGYSSTDSASISNHITQGARFLVVNGESMLSNDYIQPFIHKPVGEIGDIYFFKLQD